MRGGRQHVRATFVREPLDWRSWQACRLAAFATRNPFEPLCLMDTHDPGVAVSAAAQCAGTLTPPAVALAKARKRTAAASKPEVVSSAELPPPTRRNSFVFVFVYCTDDCSAPPCTLLYCRRRPARARPTHCPSCRTQPL
jgi:hypothetical protein